MSDPTAPFDHPRRRLIYETVQEAPGLNWNQLQRKTGLSVGALMFHLDRLEDGGVVLRRPSTSDNEVLFFTPDNEELWRDPRTRILFGNPATRRIARTLSELADASVKEIARELDLTPAAVRYHMSKLRDKELVQQEREGRQVNYRPVGALDEWFRTMD